MDELVVNSIDLISNRDMMQMLIKLFHKAASTMDSEDLNEISNSIKSIQQERQLEEISHGNHKKRKTDGNETSNRYQVLIDNKEEM